MLFIFIYNCLNKKDIILNINLDLKDVYYNKFHKIIYKRYDKKGDLIHEKLFLDLSNYENQYFLNEKGDYNIFLQKYNDLIINFSVNKHENIYINDILNKYELCISCKINLFEYYYGVNKQISLFNEIIDIDYNPYKNGITQTIKNMGLLFNESRENLLIIYEIDLNQNNLNENTKNIVKKLFFK